IGVNSAIYSPTGGSVGVGFAVSSNIVADVVDDLREHGEVSRGWLGVSIQDVTPELAEALGLDAPRGALVSSVIEDGPSDGALEAGDVILAFDGDAVATSRDLPKLVAAARAGDDATVELLRDGETEALEIEIGQRGIERHASLEDADGQGGASEILGATLEALTPEAREELGLDEDAEGAVVTSMSVDGPASQAGLRVGDVILQVGEEAVEGLATLDEALAEHDGSAALVKVLRDGWPIFVAVKT
ncbi:MAG: PDZ domain-containing protein, partial [Pseudomonadota bacterium]